MNSKKKLIIAVSSFAMVILAAVVAVVAVLAAQNVTIKSSVNIQYQAGANVMGTVSGSYKFESGETTPMSAQPISFDGTEASDPATSLTGITGSNFTKDTNDYVEFTFEFTNTSTVANYTATLSFTNGSTGNGTVTNMNIYVNGSKVDSPNLASLGSVTVNANNGTGTFTLKVELADSTADAAFNGTLLWSLAATRVS